MHNLIKPLEVLLHWIFTSLHRWINHYGFSILGLSIIVNIILIPVYYPIEKIKKRSKTKYKKMEDEVEEIKECYQGQERYYYTQALHRQYGYNPFQALIPSLGLLIQIPFFLAAYHMLSNFTDLSGHSFWFIKDLSLPDGSLNMGFGRWNSMPIIMTALNVLSSLLYTRESKPSERYQLWALAGVFLVLLYNSPSGLVLYWTMNNLFALIKQLIEHAKEIKLPKISINRSKLAKKIYYGLGIWAVFMALSILCYYDNSTMTPIYLFTTLLMTLFILQLMGMVEVIKASLKRWYFWAVVALFPLLIFMELKFAVPLFKGFLIRELNIGLAFKLGAIMGAGVSLGLPFFYVRHPLIKWKELKSKGRANLPLFFLSIFYGASLLFIWLPIMVFSSMPTAFDFGPLELLIHNLVPLLLYIAAALGLYFIVPKKLHDGLLIFTLFITFTLFLYSFVFKFHFGSIDGFALAQGENLLASLGWYFVEFSLLGLLLFGIYKTIAKHQKKLLVVMVILNLLLIGQGSYHWITMDQNMELSQESNQLPADTHGIMGFSQTETNVVVFMLDMFQGNYMEQILKENPGLTETYSGFTWYPNTLSTSFYTNASLPAIMGGWDYSAPALNEIEGGSLLDKISSSYEYMIETAQSQGMDVSIVDPTYYRTFRGDKETLQQLGVYTANSYQFKNYYIDNFAPEFQNEEGALSKITLLNTIALFRGAPLFLKAKIYNKGSWFNIEKNDFTHAINNGSFLRLLPHLAHSNQENGSFKFFESEITHIPYAISEEGEFLTTGVPDPQALDGKSGLNSYYSAYWSIEWIGEFLEWMKANEVYDNSRIILVSDHGNSLNTPYPVDWINEDRMAELGSSMTTFNRLNPLLLVKEPYQRGPLEEDLRFMSNGDTHDIAFNLSPPSQGPAQSDRRLFATFSEIWETRQLAGTEHYEWKRYYEVRNSIFDLENWERIY